MYAYFTWIHGFCILEFKTLLVFFPLYFLHKIFAEFHISLVYASVLVFSYSKYYARFVYCTLIKLIDSYKSSIIETPPRKCMKNKISNLGRKKHVKTSFKKCGYYLIISVKQFLFIQAIFV